MEQCIDVMMLGGMNLFVVIKFIINRQSSN